MDPYFASASSSHAAFEPQTNKDHVASPKPKASPSLKASSDPPEVPEFPQQPHSFYSAGTPQSSGISSTPKVNLIAVFGMIGTGKTTLIKNLAGNAAKGLRVGHGLESCKIA